MNGDYYQQILQQQQLAEQLKIIREALNNIMDKKARERMANVRLVKPELATQLEIYLYQLYQAGQLKHINEEQLVKILSELSKKKTTKIQRR